jgi:hypothetical protein
VDGISAKPVIAKQRKKPTRNPYHDGFGAETHSVQRKIPTRFAARLPLRDAALRIGRPAAASRLREARDQKRQPVDRRRIATREIGDDADRLGGQGGRLLACGQLATNEHLDFITSQLV